MSDITLYQYWRSSCSWRVRWALNYKQIPYKTESVNLLKGEQKQDTHGSRNPSLTVPSLEINDTIMNESLAILEWLEETYPKKKTLPQDPIERAKVRELCLIIASGTQPLQNLSVLNYYASEKEEKMKIGKHWIERGLKAYEKSIAHCSGTYSFGDQVSMADFCLIPQVYNANRFSVDMKQFPLISKINDTCLEREDCKAAHPDQQPDAVL